jgi:uncharacterized protein (TIGR03437 family)
MGVIIWLSSALFLVSSLAVAQSNNRIQLERIATGVPQCTDIQSPRDGSGRLFLLQQNGLIRIWLNGNLLPANFLDIRTRISTGGERGLLGLAFPPGFPDKQYFYLNYTNPSGHTVISRMRVSAADRNAADPASEQILLTVNQPFANHNGGQLQFGPDGMLYIGLGDGGSANDPQNHGQNPQSLLGKMLRINVEPNLARYEVPASNPFVNDSRFRPEIWALGLRNPWRYAFDRETGDLYIADVGQNAWEEIDFQPASSRGGENYGWVTMEGNVCVRAGCNTEGLTRPVHVYPRSEGLSVTGGYVYRGARFNWLRGAYVYGDFVTGRLWALRRNGGAWTNELQIDLTRSFAISTFGEGEDGELYIANYSNGTIFRILANQPQPRLVSGGLVNAASFAPGLVPGSLATAFTSGVLPQEQSLLASSVPLPTALAEVRLLMNNVPTPLLAAVRSSSGEQINFQVPWEIPAGTNARIQVTNGEFASENLEVPIVRLAPGVFSGDSRRALLIDASNFSLVTTPINRNATYILYATGLGPLTSPLTTGALVPSAIRLAGSATITIGNVPAEISYAGTAPGFPGVYQVNFRAGAGTPAGEQNLVLTVDGVASPARPVSLAP